MIILLFNFFNLVQLTNRVLSGSVYFSIMCGITGFIDRNKRSSEGILNNMTNAMLHRGPDGSGLELIDSEFEQVGLGHRRLSIIELSEFGKQPMQFGRLRISFNGEIYNYQEIRSVLVAAGHHFIGGSDTEVILHAYQEWGKKCVEHFIGMFAFVIYDPEKRILFCARDRVGIKPFFYYVKNGLFLFSSELKSFHEHPGFEKEVDLNAVAAFMQYGNVPTPHCIFKHCFKLKQGHLLTVQLDTLKCELEQYWNVYDHYNKPKMELSFEEAKLETEKILSSAFEYRMIADVPVGVFLSGGYDSAAVTSILQNSRTEKLKTFTVSVPDIGLNEAPYAKEIADHLGTDHTEIECRQQDASEMIPNLPFFYDEPFGDSSAIPTMLVSKMARKHVTVALSADAGDEIFAGYNRYDYLMRYGKKIHQIPSFLRSMTAGFMDTIPSQRIPVLRDKYNFHNRYEKLKGILKDPSPQRIMLSLSQQFSPDKLNELLREGDYLLYSESYMEMGLKEEFHSPLAYMMAIDYNSYLPDDILQKVDRATMSASLEGREPFLDHRIIEWAAQLPDEYKYFNGEKKYILKEIVHQYIPKSLMDRPKMGFAIPVADWLRNDLRDLVESYINESLIQKQGIFNWSFVSNLKSDFFNGKKELDVKLWYLLMIKIRNDRWMSNIK